jgi:hypothetical protein
MSQLEGGMACDLALDVTRWPPLMREDREHRSLALDRQIAPPVGGGGALATLATTTMLAAVADGLD